MQDTGVILGVSEAPPSVSFGEMSRLQQALAGVIQQDPAVESLSSFIGVDGINTVMNSGRIQINLKPLAQRAGAGAVIRRLQEKLKSVEGITLYLQPVQDLSVEDRVSRTQFQYTLEDADAKELTSWTARLVEKLDTLGSLRDVATDEQNGGLQTTLVIDRDTASRLGIGMQQIDDTLYDAFGQRLVSTMFTQSNQYHVVLEVAKDFRNSPDDLADIFIRSAAGTEVPLSSFTRFEQTTSPLTINHQGQFPVVTISFNLPPGESLGTAVKDIQKAEQEIGLPPSIHTEFQGTAAAFQNSLANEAYLNFGRSCGGLYCARRPVRKLHSPHHHSFHAAIRGCRRHSGHLHLP